MHYVPFHFNSPIHTSPLFIIRRFKSINKFNNFNLSSYVQGLGLFDLKCDTPPSVLNVGLIIIS